MQIRIERQYDSLKRNEAGDFGFGWRQGYNFDFQVDELQHDSLKLNSARNQTARARVSFTRALSAITPASAPE